MKEYVQIILEEYKEKVPKIVKERLESIQDFSELVQIEDTKTISLFATVNDSVIHLPVTVLSKKIV